MIVSPLEYLTVNTETNIWVDLNMGLYDETQEMADFLLLQLFKLGKLVTTKHCELDSFVSQLHEIRDCVDRNWTVYHEEGTLQGQALQYASEGEILYRDPSTALILAYFAAAKLMISLADPAGTDNPPSTMDRYCQDILNCSTFLFQRKGRIGCISLPVFLPLALVAMYATSSTYRKMAYTSLNERVRTTPFRGLQSILAERLSSAGNVKCSFRPNFVYTNPIS